VIKETVSLLITIGLVFGILHLFPDPELEEIKKINHNLIKVYEQQIQAEKTYKSGVYILYQELKKRTAI
jgi:uncharacterized protein YqgQ